MGAFVVVEGPEGAGKSTLVRWLAGQLRAKGHRVLAVREPGGTPIAEAARKLALKSRHDRAYAAELFLFLAARADLVERVIRPALASGQIVIADRFGLSTMAYQVFGQGVPRAAFEALARLALEGLRPDLTLILDIGPAEGLARALVRGETNRYEALDPGFHERVRAGFRAIAAAEPERCAVVDATAAPEGVEAEILRIVRARLAA